MATTPVIPEKSGAACRPGNRTQDIITGLMPVTGVTGITFFTCPLPVVAFIARAAVPTGK
jgi:hypothetical protein